jgi:GAF domain-containing protein
MIEPQQLARTFVDVADTLVDEFDLIEFLHTVTHHAATLADASAAGLLLADHHGQLQLLAATDERAETVELFQVQSHEGPCQDCFRLGVPVVNADLREASDRWPRFAQRAVAEGYRSVHAFPLRLRGERIGALNLFSVDVGSLNEAEAGVVQALADISTIGLLQERAIRHAEALTEQLQGALNSRIILEQAKGVLSQMHGVSTSEAFQLMRDYSRARRTPLTGVATAVVSDPGSVPGLTAPT